MNNKRNARNFSFFVTKALKIYNKSKHLNSIVAFKQHMLQKRNDLEIVEQLIKKPMHIRALATKLNIIPSTIQRTIKKLEEQNIVDYQTQGKNKIYQLKKTPEAKQYIFITEHYKLIKIMQKTELRFIIKQLQEKTNNLIVLFGSYAKNLEKKDSDIDIYIETPDLNLQQELSKISKKLSIKIGNLNKESLLTKEIIKDHIIIQKVERFYELI